MTAVKENKVYEIAEKEAARYAAQGFDIYNGEELVKPAAGKTVPYEKYLSVLKELEELKAKGKKRKVKETASEEVTEEAGE